MGIGTNRDHPRAYNPLLRKQYVFNSYTADLKIMSNAMFPCKVTDDFRESCRFNIFIRRKMIWHKDDFFASNTGFPIVRNASIAGGAVISFAKIRSSWQTIKSPLLRLLFLHALPVFFVSLSCPSLQHPFFF